MNKQKICVIGDGLTGLTVALFLSKLKIDVCIVGKFKKKISFQDGRTTAISPSNYDFFLNLINLTRFLHLRRFYPLYFPILLLILIFIDSF